MDFGGSAGYHQTGGGGGKLPPVSPSYPTSDLGSSPRSSISASHYSQLGMGGANWTALRDGYNGGRKMSSEIDLESDCGASNFASLNHRTFSPVPFSPYSDCGIDLACSASVTPYSNRSPNLSPSPSRSGNLHFRLALPI